MFAAQRNKGYLDSPGQVDGRMWLLDEAASVARVVSAYARRRVRVYARHSAPDVELQV